MVRISAIPNDVVHVLTDVRNDIIENMSGEYSFLLTANMADDMIKNMTIQEFMNSWLHHSGREKIDVIGFEIIEKILSIPDLDGNEEF